MQNKDNLERKIYRKNITGHTSDSSSFVQDL